MIYIYERKAKQVINQTLECEHCFLIFIESCGQFVYVLKKVQQKNTLQPDAHTNKNIHFSRKILIRVLIYFTEILFLFVFYLHTFFNLKYNGAFAQLKLEPLKSEISVDPPIVVSVDVNIYCLAPILRIHL